MLERAVLREADTGPCGSEQSQNFQSLLCPHTQAGRAIGVDGRLDWA